MFLYEIVMSSGFDFCVCTYMSYMSVCMGHFLSCAYILCHVRTVTYVRCCTYMSYVLVCTGHFFVVCLHFMSRR